MLIVGLVWLALVVVSLAFMVWAMLTAPMAEEDEQRGFVVIEEAPALRERLAACLRRPSAAAMGDDAPLEPVYRP